MTIKFSIFTHFFLQDLTHFYLSLHPLSKLQIWSHFFLCYVVYFLLQCHLSRSVETITDFIYLFKGPSSQSYGFFSSPVWMWELDYKESWLLKNWCFWTVVLEKTFESPLVCKKIQPVNPKGNQSWILIGRTDAEAEMPVFWPPDARNWLIGKDPDAGKDWSQEKKGMTEDEMVGCHHQHNGHEFE